MKATKAHSMTGRLLHLIYAPKGEIEGAMVMVQGASVQVVVDKHDPDAAGAFQRLVAGQTVGLQVSPAKPSDKGSSAHRVFEFVALESVDGAPPPDAPSEDESPYEGTVTRLNYARHGEPNGVVLDSGDFIHTKPDGFTQLKLKLGDRVTAQGDAQRMADDSGWAVEADVVNGQSL